MSKVHVMDHPLISHKISLIRREDLGSKDFREMISEIAMLICYEATRDLKLQDVQIKTPICEMTISFFTWFFFAEVIRRCGKTDKAISLNAIVAP